jgi:hypothetical protein
MHPGGYHVVRVCERTVITFETDSRVDTLVNTRKKRPGQTIENLM